MTAPLPDSYWVVPGRLLAGEYPFAADEATGREKLEAVLAAGIDAFLDLTEAGEHGLRAYAPWLKTTSHGRRVRRQRFGVPDFGTAGDAELNAILDTIDGWLSQGRRIYVHCFGGIGRTGMVVGCHLVRHGRTGQEALEEIRRRRRNTRDGGRPSPETDAQRRVVLEWAGRDRRRAGQDPGRRKG